MKRSSAELKKLARTTLKGKYGTFIGTAVIYGLITCGISFITSFATLGLNGISSTIARTCIQLVLSFVWIIFEVGIIYQAMQACREKTISVTDLFYGFTHNPDRFIVVSLLTSLIVLALVLPAIVLFAVSFLRPDMISAVILIIGFLAYIAGIVFIVILILGLSLCYYLIIDNPGMKAMESIKTSWQLMKGNKGRGFYLSLSFLGLIVLGCLSLGVAFLWITPYMNVTMAYFYFDVIGALDPPVEEVAQTPVTPAEPVSPVASLVEPTTATTPYVDDPVIHTQVIEEAERSDN